MISIGRVENTGNTADIVDQLNSILADTESQLQSIIVGYDDSINALQDSINSIEKAISNS